MRLSSDFCADGLALACRLSKRITAVSLQIKKIIACYNEQDGEPLTWQAAVDLHCQDQEVSNTSVSGEIMRQAVGHLRLFKRSGEEIVRLRHEMMNCLTFYQDKIEQLGNIQQRLATGCVSRLNLGSLNLVQKQLRCDGKRLLELQHTFSRWISTDNQSENIHPTSPPSSLTPTSSPASPLSTQPPSSRLINLTPSSPTVVPQKSLSETGRSPHEPSNLSDVPTSLSVDLCTMPRSSHTRGRMLLSTSDSRSTEHQSVNALSSMHNTSPLSSTLSISSPPPPLCTQPSSLRFNFPSVVPHKSLLVTRRFPLKKSVFKSASCGSSDSATSLPVDLHTTPHSSHTCISRGQGQTLHSNSDLQATHQGSKPDAVLHYSYSMDTNKQSLSRSFQDESMQYHASIREPEAEKQQSEIFGCSDDESSSGEEEELEKQYWRAERFHMEEFVKQMRVKFKFITVTTVCLYFDM